MDPCARGFAYGPNQFGTDRPGHAFLRLSSRCCALPSRKRHNAATGRGGDEPARLTFLRTSRARENFRALCQPSCGHIDALPDSSSCAIRGSHRRFQIRLLYSHACPAPPGICRRLNRRRNPWRCNRPVRGSSTEGPRSGHRSIGKSVPRLGSA